MSLALLLAAWNPLVPCMLGCLQYSDRWHEERDGDVPAHALHACCAQVCGDRLGAAI